MERKLYVMTERDLAKCSTRAMPSDDEIKAMPSRKPWGLVKKQLALDILKVNPEYVRGIWQGRVDAENGLDYSEERTTSAYNLGYYRGYTDYATDRKGWDPATRERFDTIYGRAK